MPKVGESSHPAEEEYIDIPVDTEQLVVAEPVEPVAQSESEPEEEYEVSEEEPPEEEYEVSEEEPVESEDPTEGQGEVAQLEARIVELEEANQTHQDMEEQHKSLVYQLLEENAELTEKQLEDGLRIEELEAENTGLKNKLAESELQRQQLQASKQEMGEYWQSEIEARDEMEAQRDEARQQVTFVEDELREKKVKLDRATYAYRSSFGRLQSRVFYYPVEEGLSRSTISRRQVMEICDQEYEEAVYRGMHHH